PMLWIRALRDSIEPALDGRAKSRGVGVKAPQVNPPLGNDHIVRPGVDEADRTLMSPSPHRKLGILGEAPDAYQAISPCPLNRHNIHLARKTIVRPAFGIEVDLVPGLDQVSTQIRNVRLGASSRRIDVLKVEGQVHRSNPSRWFRWSAILALSH